MKKQTEPLTDRQKGDKRVILSRRELVRVHRKDTLFSIAVFTLTTIGCFFFNHMASDPTLNIAMLYTLGVFIITRYTEGYLYGVLFAVTSVTERQLLLYLSVSEFQLFIWRATRSPSWGCC